MLIKIEHSLSTFWINIWTFSFRCAGENCNQVNIFLLGKNCTFNRTLKFQRFVHTFNQNYLLFYSYFYIIEQIRHTNSFSHPILNHFRTSYSHSSITLFVGTLYQAYVFIYSNCKTKLCIEYGLMTIKTEIYVCA